MYIIPDKFLNFDTCILKISADILKELLMRKELKYDELHKKFKDEFKDETDYIFVPALNFLFLIGKIEYIKKGDKVRLLL